MGTKAYKAKAGEAHSKTRAIREKICKKKNAKVKKAKAKATPEHDGFQNELKAMNANLNQLQKLLKSGGRSVGDLKTSEKLEEMKLKDKEAEREAERDAKKEGSAKKE